MRIRCDARWRIRWSRNPLAFADTLFPMNSMIPRRSFLGGASLAGAALIAPALAQSDAAPAKRKLKVGLIGAGGRGIGAVKDFSAAAAILGCEVELTGVADAFAPQALLAATHLQVPADRCFGGFDAYRKVLDSGCDYLIMATPPCFRPLHFAAAVEAGKHCFIEKPVAVDPVGARAVIATGEQAKAKGLSVVTGTQRRHMARYLRNKALIDAGAIGGIRGGVVQWNGSVPWIKRRNEGESNADYLARNWLNFTEMSGDIIVEQHVHNLDVAVWFLGRLPVSAIGMGGRARRETGNQYDFFSVDYDFGNEVHIHSQCRQLAGAYQRVGEVFTGSQGWCHASGKLEGRDTPVPEVHVDSDNGMVQEHVEWIRSVLEDRPLNHARRIAEVSLVAIMGRLSAYTGQLVRWSDVAENEQSPFYHLTCSPAAADFESGEVSLPEESPPVPGTA
ncbi:MAG: Gfo/Idh/MocA family oxidoreductase [Verrucomicrobia bacterium]|nr:Gfo/Idh/MocA family oxidoreductase [Verrucomicrobiota bacterium]